MQPPVCGAARAHIHMHMPAPPLCPSFSSADACPALPPPPLPCLQFYGLSEGEVVHFGDVSSGKFGAFWVNGGKVVGGFLESGSPEENTAIKKVAQAQPAAPADLAQQGLAFALAA